jgi:hypothetical protein
LIKKLVVDHFVKVCIVFLTHGIKKPKSCSGAPEMIGGKRMD